ncbi:MAG: RNA polymerase sigma factor [Myxococcaceae bacterium]|jgi:RNA polymerase sigma factor (sigma-70 family)|nr:RNA polymerase sigma factor [Myxococcaceae bacterium]MCA3015773.1 RNA polymerase sigma factor [Myxococcaceae bacterium]
MESPSDEELMERFQDGDARALDALFDRRAAAVHGFLSRMVRDPALADDLLQTTFLSVVRSADRYQRGLKVLPWLLTIAGNAARDTLRHRRLQVEVLSDDDEGTLPEQGVQPALSDPGQRRRIEQAFAQLPPQQRECVILHKLEGLSFEQIAEMLDISETAARIRAHRGYERLRALLGEDAS